MAREEISSATVQRRGKDGKVTKRKMTQREQDDFEKMFKKLAGSKYEEDEEGEPKKKRKKKLTPEQKKEKEGRELRGIGREFTKRAVGASLMERPGKDASDEQKAAYSIFQNVLSNRSPDANFHGKQPGIYKYLSSALTTPSGMKRLDDNITAVFKKYGIDRADSDNYALRGQAAQRVLTAALTGKIKGTKAGQITAYAKRAARSVAEKEAFNQMDAAQRKAIREGRPGYKPPKKKKK